MAQNDALFQLIRSLTPGEKRYFKLYAARQSEAQKTNYEKLFDEYNELPDGEPYNEEEFLKKLKKKKLGKYFSDDKKHLSQLLLKAMRSYNAEKKAEGRLADMIQEMNFLIEKGLFEHCAKICDRAWEIAEERELTEQKIMLLHIRRTIDRSDHGSNRANYQKDLRSQEILVLEQLADEREASYLYEQIYGIYITRQLSDRADQIAEINERLSELYKKTSLTFDCINTIIKTRCVIYDHTEQYKEALELTKHLIEQWEKNQWRIKEESLQYVKLLGNFVVFTSRTGTYETIPALIKKLESLETMEKEVAKEIFYLVTFCRLILYINSEDHLGSLSIIPEIKKGLKTYGSLLTFIQKRLLYSNICLIYHKNKMYSEVIDEVQAVHALVGRGKEKQHRIEDVRVYEFIAHYELGNTELLHYTIRNNQRFFKEHQPEMDFIDHMWKLLKQLIQSTDKPKTAKKKIKASLEELACPEANMALKKELILWLSS